MSFDRLSLAVLLLSLPACSKDRPTQESSSSNQPSSSPVAQPPAYEGFHDNSTCDAISGWGWDRNHPDQAVKLDIFDGDNWINTVLANERRADLADAHRGNGYHAFTMKTPTSVRDGRPHVITVKYHPNGAVLDHSNQRITCPSQ